MRKLLALLVMLLFTLPVAGTVSVALLVNPALASCATTSLVVGPIPDSLTAATRDGSTVTLGRQQLTHAATVISIGAATREVGRVGIVIALMAALTESNLRMLANSTAYPHSAEYPNDGEGGDHDSLGMFQMRPSSGWGTVADLMDPDYQARAFYGGSDGPNSGSPRGLLDIPGWRSLTPGQAAQSVEVSAFPDRYDNVQPVAEAILGALTKTAGSAPLPSEGAPAEASRIVVPMVDGTYTWVSSFGWRTDPFTGRPRFHAGADLAATDDTPILATADGVVTFAGASGGFGNLIVVRHTVDGERVDTYYAHMWSSGVHVVVGETVAAGQHIGDVGSSGRSEGPHLHFEVHIGIESRVVNPLAWLTEHGATGVDAATVAPASCSPGGSR
ncbi:murein DD-endopeptidase MepM/ murein hydrolase activator NlpD [Microbacterium terrae]|uniref:Murein DD-endopeptidase MepM n=1 Tax=Microbacterium terrae TaxID=69369 RepID=A0A0M2H1Y1_9MICO|nr:M23 family metallopeptidase [Microbacterium terrae]KJL37573.1 Murein DD-endopeptidase MepM [Microbacterium terrae]MBP1076404.1 murein DD-endopeptidase MepM/ murein hydrolase activator NlpD [Microbacterium terrae]GLJ97230.1 hypothetical protein GCM10017594_04270 [Microbacterium terrae]